MSQIPRLSQKEASKDLVLSKVAGYSFRNRQEEHAIVIVLVEIREISTSREEAEVFVFRGLAIKNPSDPPNINEGKRLAFRRTIRCALGRGVEPIRRKEAFQALSKTVCPFLKKGELIAQGCYSFKKPFFVDTPSRFGQFPLYERVLLYGKQGLTSTPWAYNGIEMLSRLKYPSFEAAKALAGPEGIAIEKMTNLHDRMGRVVEELSQEPIYQTNLTP